MELKLILSDTGKFLAQAIDETIKSALKDRKPSIIFRFLEDENLTLNEIPYNTDLFS